nr:RNA-directed DNA polymerase, eukaryota, reverse transcriptase zinc-binding domain protein [Tanacetum cinerariifolium]
MMVEEYTKNSTIIFRIFDYGAEHDLSATSSILINGSPTPEFNIQRGIRQGDPLSLFLFIIAMEGLHVAMEDAMAVGLYRDAYPNGKPLFFPLVVDLLLLPRSWELLSWHFLNNPQALWARLIVSIHDTNENASSFFNHVKNHGVWGRIIGSINTMHEKGFIPHSSIKRRVNSGSSTKFWHDTWIGTTSFQNQFPRLYRLASIKDIMVRDCWNHDWNFTWSRNISSGTNASQLASLHNLLSETSLNNSKDIWAWQIESPMFTVKSARKHIDNYYLPDGNFATRWNRYLPKKINIFV